MARSQSSAWNEGRAPTMVAFIIIHKVLCAVRIGTARKNQAGFREETGFDASGVAGEKANIGHLMQKDL